MRIIIFDFDGTLVDSDILKKHEAWFEIFPENGMVPRKILLDVLSRISETRFDILREIFRMLGKEENERERLVEEHAARYNVVVQEGIARIGLMPGVAEGIRDLSKTYRLYIVSATPEYGVRETIKRLGLENLFRGVSGKPASKEENIQKIILRENAEPSQITVVGNGEDDRQAAKRIRTRFIGFADSLNQWRGTSFDVVHNWSELITVLKQK